jgi:hypothetical protein
VLLTAPANWGARWVHLAVTYDGADVVWYANGASVGSVSATGLGNLSGDVFVGGLDVCYASEVAIYDHSLSSTNILNHFNAIGSLDTTPTYRGLSSHGGSGGTEDLIIQILNAVRPTYSYA